MTERKKLTLKTRPVTATKVNKRVIKAESKKRDFTAEGGKSNKKAPAPKVKVPGKLGGYREGAGRKPGYYKKALELVDQLRSDGMTPVQYLLQEMRDINNPKGVRIEAAKAAAPFIHPRLSTTEIANKDGKPFATANMNGQSTVPVDPQDAAKWYKTILG